MVYLKAIRDDLQQVQPPTDRRTLRYLVLTPLYNNPQVSDRQLRLARAAISKLVNSLSWQAEITLPLSIDPQQTILRIDLRDYGWDAAR